MKGRIESGCGSATIYNIWRTWLPPTVLLPPLGIWDAGTSPSATIVFIWCAWGFTWEVWAGSNKPNFCLRLWKLDIANDLVVALREDPAMLHAQLDSCSPANSSAMHPSHGYIDATRGGVLDAAVVAWDRRPRVATGVRRVVVWQNARSEYSAGPYDDGGRRRRHGTACRFAKLEPRVKEWNADMVFGLKMRASICACLATSVSAWDNNRPRPYCLAHTMSFLAKKTKQGNPPLLPKSFTRTNVLL